MGNSVSVDAVSPPLEYASEEANNIPFEPYGNDPVLGSFGTAMRVRPKPGQFIGIEMAVSKTIRVMNSNPSHLEDDKDRIREKVAQLSRERHPHMLKTIATYFYNDYNGVQFTIVVEFAGENLEAYLPPWPSKAASKPPRPQWFGCLMGAVAYLHRHGIRHGNITPESILVRNSKTVLLSNLDMSEVDAWRTQQTTINMKSGRWRMTACGRYGAPEAGQEQEVGVRRGRAADIFSLGAVFVEMVLANCNDRQELGPALESVLRSQNSTAKSYAYRVYAVDNWLADLTMSSSPSQGWETEVLSFCRDMLDPEPDARPRADELSSRWKTVVVAHPQLRHATCNECEVSGDDMTRTTMTADADAYLDSTDDSGETDLFRAAGYGREDRVKTLLKEKTVSAVNKQNVEGWSALHYAARMNHEIIVGILLGEDAEIKLADDAGWTALHFAARKGHKGILTQLLKRGADVKAAGRRGHTALHLAAEGGHADVISMLLEEMEKVDVNKKTKQGHSALWIAASKGHRDVLKLLIGCDKVDVRGLAV